MAITIRQKGWKEGLRLVAAYAPTSSLNRKTQAQRVQFKEHLASILEKSKTGDMLVVGVDFNAEVGAGKDDCNRDVLGAFGATNRTKTGEDLIELCREEGLMVAGSFFAQRERSTWWHFRFGTGHELDHLLIRRAQRWNVLRCRTLHFGRMPGGQARTIRRRKEMERARKTQTTIAVEVAQREDGVIAWSPYTDHHPVEIVLRIGKNWATEAERKNEIKVLEPDWSKVWGGTKEAKDYSQKLAAKTNERIEAMGENNEDWETVCKVCNDTALEVLGSKGKPHPRQWLRGKEDLKAQLDEDVHKAREELYSAVRNSLTNPPENDARVKQVKKKLRAQTRIRRKTLRGWERIWWEEVGQRASEAAFKGNQGEPHQALRELQIRGEVGRKDGGKHVVADVEKERESWKEHFEKVSKTRGEVKDTVWDNVTNLGAEVKWLGEDPTDIEMDTCVSRMGTKRAPGKDKFTAEALKFGGKKLRKKIYRIVRKMWRSAAGAEDGNEAEEWPSSWKVGLVVPLWKRKGKRTDKNTWRGITLLSVGSKLLARVVALRVQQWSEGFLKEEQNGFRRGRGVDDALMVSRRVAEEVCRLFGNDWVLMSFFDIKKAYPRVCRDALWKLMCVRGFDNRLIKDCKALHEGTAYSVKFLGGISSMWWPDRGLREGCPSSPPLFNVYHDAVMEDFRCRRAVAAKRKNQTPGLEWPYKVDGRLSKRARGRTTGEGRWGKTEEGNRKSFAGEVHTVTIGDVEFADDTTILGEPDELVVAEGILAQTMLDWEERVHPGKTERLRLSGNGRSPFDVRAPGEASEVRNVGGWISERGDNKKDTAQKVSRGFEIVRKTAKAWGLGSQRGRGGNSGLNITSRLQVMKGILMPTLTTFARSRSWSEAELKQLQRVSKYAVI